VADQLQNGKRYSFRVVGEYRRGTETFTVGGLGLGVEYATDVQLVPDPLPHTEDSVVLDRFGYAWQRCHADVWTSTRGLDSRPGEVLQDERGPCTVLVDPGKP
jgi:hypothetical protein